MTTRTSAVLEELYSVPENGKAEIVDGELVAADVVKVYRASDPEHPAIYRRGDLAEAEPAVPGWSMPVDDLFN